MYGNYGNAAGGRGFGQSSASMTSSNFRTMYASMGQRGVHGGGRGAHSPSPYSNPRQMQMQQQPMQMQQVSEAATSLPPPPPKVLVVGTTEAAVRAWPVIYAAGFEISAVVATSLPPKTTEKAKKEKSDAGELNEDERRRLSLAEEAATKRAKAFIRGCVTLFSVPLPPSADSKVSPTATGAPSVSAASSSPPFPLAGSLPSNPAMSATATTTAAATRTGDEEETLRGVVAVPSPQALFRSSPTSGTPPPTAQAAASTTTATAPTSAATAASANETGSSTHPQQQLQGFKHLLEAADFVFVATGDDFAFAPPVTPPPSATMPASTARGFSTTPTSGRPGFDADSFTRDYSYNTSLSPAGSYLSKAQTPPSPATAAAGGGREAAKDTSKEALRNREAFLGECVVRRKHLVFGGCVPAADARALEKLLAACGDASAARASETGAVGKEAGRVLMAQASPLRHESARMKALVRAMGLSHLAPQATTATGAGASSASTASSPVPTPPPPSSVFSVSHAGAFAPKSTSSSFLPPGVLAPPTTAAAATATVKRTASEEGGGKMPTESQGGNPSRRQQHPAGAVGRVRRVELHLCNPIRAEDWQEERAGGGETREEGEALHDLNARDFGGSVLPTVRRSAAAMECLLCQALHFVDALMSSRMPIAVQCRPLAFPACRNGATDGDGSAGGRDENDVSAEEPEDFVYPEEQEDENGSRQVAVDGTKKAKETSARSNEVSLPIALEAQLFFDVKYPVDKSPAEASAKSTNENAALPSTLSPVPVPPQSQFATHSAIAVASTSPRPSAASPPSSSPDSQKSQPRATDGEKTSNAEEAAFISEMITVKLYLSVDADAPFLTQELTISGTEGTIEMHDGILDCCTIDVAEPLEATDADDALSPPSVLPPTADISRAAARCLVVTYGNRVSSTGALLRVRQEKTLYRFTPLSLSALEEEESKTREESTVAAAPHSAASSANTSSNGGGNKVNVKEKEAKRMALQAIKDDEKSLDALSLWKSLFASCRYSTAAASVGSTASPTASPYTSRYGRSGTSGMGNLYRRAGLSAAAAAMFGDRERLEPTKEKQTHPYAQRFVVKDVGMATEAMRRMLAVQVVRDKLLEAGGVLSLAQ